MTYVTSQPRGTPAEPSPREMSATTTSTNAARMKSRPLERAREGPSMKARPLGKLRGSSTSCCFFTANGGLFERPRAAFFYRRGCCRHAVHDGGDGGDDEEENSFSDGRCHPRHQGEAANSCSGFLCFVVTLFNIRGCGICHWPADFSAVVTPSANRNSITFPRRTASRR